MTIKRSRSLLRFVWASIFCCAAFSCASRPAPPPSPASAPRAGAENAEPASAPVEYEEVEIVLERTACYGTCPVYVVTLDQDGRVQYEGKMFVAVEGRRGRQIDPKRVREIVAYALSIGFFEMRGRYDARITDLPTTITTLRLDGRRKRVENYFGAPEELRRLEAMIDEAAGVAEWVGPPQTAPQQ